MGSMIPTVIEQYEHRLAAMAETERFAMTNIEATSQRCLHLQHQVTQLSAEHSRLHQLISTTQKSCQQSIGKIQDLTAYNEKMGKAYLIEQQKYKECKGMLQASQQSCEKLELLEEQLKKKNKELLNEKLAAETHNQVFKEMIEKFEKNMEQKKKIEEKRMESLNQVNEVINTLKKASFFCNITY